MNANTGTVHELPEHFRAELGELLTPRLPELQQMIQADQLGAAERAKVSALKREIESGDPVVAVSADVAHQQKLGQRELDRRRRRRR